MEQLPYNVLDMAIVGILGLSAIIGLIRGFIREVLSLAAWFGAGWVTLTFFEDGRSFLLNYVTGEAIAGLIAGIVLFIVALIALSIAARFASRLFLKLFLMGMLDRSLGVIFGVGRGAVILCIGYVMALQLLPASRKAPDWITYSQLLPYVAEASGWLESIIPADLMSPRTFQELQRAAEGTDSGSETGYTREIQQGLDRLIEGIQSK